MGSVPVPAWSRRAWCWCVWRPGEVHSFCRVSSHAILILLPRKGSIALCGDKGWAPVSAAVLGWSLALSGALLQQLSGSALLLCLGICKIPSKSLALRPSQTWAKGRVKTTFLEHMTKLKILAKNKFPFLHMSQDFLSSSLFTYKGDFLMPSVVLSAFCSCLFKFDWTLLLWSQTSWRVYSFSFSPPTRPPPWDCSAWLGAAASSHGAGRLRLLSQFALCNSALQSFFLHSVE